MASRPPMRAKSSTLGLRGVIMGGEGSNGALSHSLMGRPGAQATSKAVFAPVPRQSPCAECGALARTKSFWRGARNANNRVSPGLALLNGWAKRGGARGRVRPCNRKTPFQVCKQAIMKTIAGAETINPLSKNLHTTAVAAVLLNLVHPPR